MKLNFKKAIFLCFVIVFIRGNILAQSTYKEVDSLALKCSKGNTISCEKLIDIALYEKSDAIRAVATNNISNNDILIKIAKNDKAVNVRYSAVSKITDQNILEDILKNDEHSVIKKTVIGMIKDYKIIADIAKNNKSYFLREAAVLQLTDQNILADIAKKDESFTVRKAAIKKIYNQNDLNIKEINDQLFLVDIAKNDNNISKDAVNRISDQNLLLEIAKNSTFMSVRCIALNKLKGNEHYKQIVEIIDQNINSKNNLAAVGALKIIPLDKFLMNNYEVLQIDVEIKESNARYTIGVWKALDFTVKIMTNKFVKSFNFQGEGGGISESYSNIGKMHMGNINIDEICQLLLSSISKEDLFKISKESDVFYLREVAKSKLQNKTFE